MYLESTFEQLGLVLFFLVIGIVGGTHLVMAAERSHLEEPIKPCSRCGEDALLIGDAVERPRLGGLTIIERFSCVWCGHEQLQIINTAESLDGA